jgi:hypothetical protein
LSSRGENKGFLGYDLTKDGSHVTSARAVQGAARNRDGTPNGLPGSLWYERERERVGLRKEVRRWIQS